ncbi:hypothetical protein T492DRAFT_234712 [Pavlovales sp. CCMP2436]|nr:hypothetical protein T492DRAFT_234712 [Pavlovales sp. CCMP2436]
MRRGDVGQGGRSLQSLGMGQAAELPLLGVLFAAPLAYVDGAGAVHAMEPLDFEKERELICESVRESGRQLGVRFEAATTDRLRTLVTLGRCAGLHYSGHGDPQFLTLEDGKGLTHFVRTATLAQLLGGADNFLIEIIFDLFICSPSPSSSAVRIRARIKKGFFLIVVLLTSLNLQPEGVRA